MSFLESHSREIGVVCIGFGFSYVLYKIEPFIGAVSASFVFMYLSSVIAPLEQPEESLLMLARS